MNEAFLARTGKIKLTFNQFSDTPSLLLLPGVLMFWCSYWSICYTLPCCSRCSSSASPPEFSGSPILVSQSLCVYSLQHSTMSRNVALKKTDLLPHKVTKRQSQGHDRALYIDYSKCMRNCLIRKCLPSPMCSRLIY